MANLTVRSINFGVIFIGIFAACSFAAAKKEKTKINGVQENFDVQKPTVAVTTTTVTMIPHETAAVGQIFSFDKDASPATIFGHVLIPCVLFTVLAVTLYGGLRGSQYLYSGLKNRIKARRHQPSYRNMRGSDDNHAVVMVTDQDIV